MKWLIESEWHDSTGMYFTRTVTNLGIFPTEESAKAEVERLNSREKKKFKRLGLKGIKFSEWASDTPYVAYYSYIPIEERDNA